MRSMDSRDKLGEESKILTIAENSLGKLMANVLSAMAKYVSRPGSSELSALERAEFGNMHQLVTSYLSPQPSSRAARPPSG